MVPKLKVVPVTVGPVRFSGVPFLDSCANTVSNESSDSITAGPNSTVQVTVTVDTQRTMVSGLLVTVTDCGSGTVELECEYHTAIRLANSL